MKKLFLVLCTFLTLKAAGQDHLVGMKGGVSLTNVTGSDFAEPRGNRLGAAAGVTYDCVLKKHFSVGAELLYNQRGFTSDIILTDQYGNPTGKFYKIKFNYDYLSLPVKIGIITGNKIYIFLNVGIVPSVLVNSTIAAPLINLDTNGVENDKPIKVTKSVNRYDFAGTGELGFGYKFKNKCWLFTSASYQHSFGTVTNAHYFSNLKLVHYGTTFSLGVKYVLGKSQ